MSRQTKNPKTGADETWLNVAESADYIEKSEATFRTALRKYTAQTGKTIQYEQDGNERLYLQTDLDNLLRALYTFTARKKGLL